VQRPLTARFDGEVAGGAGADSFFVISARAVGAIDDDDDVGFGERRRWWRRRVAQRGSATYGVIDSDRQILQH
jgi:hypothetical protein